MNPFRFGLLAAMPLAVFPLLTAPPSVRAAEETTAGDHSRTASDCGPKPGGAGASEMMEQMQGMHAQMMAAKAPAERAALMQAQMAVMQNGMSMMQGMQGSSAKRMDMMQMMMQMMMDRMSMPAAEAQQPDAPK